MKTIGALLFLCVSLHADSIHWYVDAISQNNTVDYLVEAAPPPFPGYDYQIFTDLKVEFPYDTLNAIFCYNPFADCQVSYSEAPQSTPPSDMGHPGGHGDPMPSRAPETSSWMMCAGGVVAIALGNLRKRR